MRTKKGLVSADSSHNHASASSKKPRLISNVCNGIASCAKSLKGFTLLELLITIAIIGTVSTIVITSVSTARTKSRNSYITSSVLQYVNAFSTYYSTNGSYPTASVQMPFMLMCLGHRTSQCGRLTYNDGTLSYLSQIGTQDAQLDAEVETVFPAAPSFENVLYDSSVATESYFAGPTYECNYFVGTRCASVNLTWHLFGTGRECVRGATKMDTMLATSCILTME